MLGEDPYAAFGEPVEAPAAVAQAPKPEAAAPPLATPDAAPPTPTEGQATPDPYDGLAQTIDAIRPEADFEQNDQSWREGKTPQEAAIYDKLTPEQKRDFLDGKLQVPGIFPGLAVDVAADGHQEDAPPPEKPNTLSGLSEKELHDRFDKLPSVMKPGLAELFTHGTLAGVETDASATVEALMQALAHPATAVETGGGSVMDAYHKGRTDALAAVDYARLNNPGTAPVAEIGGAIVNPLGAEAKGFKGLAKVGAGYGAVSGFEDSNGGIGDRLMEGGKRGLIGAVAAPALGAAIKAPGAINNLRPSRNAAAPLVEAFDRQGVDPLVPYVGGTGAQMASGVTHMTLGGIPLSEAAERTILQARAARDKIAAKMGWAKDGMGAGRAAQKGAASFVDSSGDKASDLYRAIPVAGDRAAELGGTTTALSDVNAGLPSNPELSKLLEDPRLKGFQEAIEGRTEQVPTGLLGANGSPITRPVQKGGGLSWADMQAFRSYVGEKMNGMAFQSDTSQKALSRLYAGLSKDMEATARAEGPKALAAFQRANTYYRARQERIAQVIEPILGKDGKAGPQAAFNQIQSWASNKGETVRIAQLVRSLPEDEAATVRATIFSKLGNAKAGQQNWEGDEFSAATFGTMWHSMDPAARTALFPGERYRQDIQDILQVTHAMRDSAKYANNSKTALGANAFGHISGLLANIPFTLATASLEFGSGKLLAYPKFARWLASMPKKPNAPAVLQHIRQLNSVAAAQPAVANEIHALQERLASFFANPSTPMAAQDVDQSGLQPEQGKGQ